MIRTGTVSQDHPRACNDPLPEVQSQQQNPEVQEANKQAKALRPPKPFCSQTTSAMKVRSEGLEVAVILQIAFVSKKISNEQQQQQKHPHPGILGVKGLLTMYTFPQLAIKPTFKARNNRKVKILMHWTSGIFPWGLFRHPQSSRCDDLRWR